MCTSESLVCLICHSVVSHLQGDTQTQLQCVYIHSDLYTTTLNVNSSIQRVNRTDDVGEAESGQRVMRFEREAREEGRREHDGQQLPL